MMYGMAPKSKGATPMTSRLLALTGGVISAVAIGLAGIGAQAQGPAFRTPWGDPDIQGINCGLVIFDS
jgi:hypothetical protein